MLSFDSNRWESFAEENSVKLVQGIIKKLENIREDDPEVNFLLGELNSQLCHQFSISPIAFAAMPHMIKIAECRDDYIGTSLTIIIGTIIAYANESDLDQIDQDIKEWYLNSVQSFRQSIFERLNEGKVGDFENIYLYWASIVAILVPSAVSRVLLVHSMEGFEEIEIDSCPKCEEYIFITDFCSTVDYDSSDEDLIPIEIMKMKKISKWDGTFKVKEADKCLMYIAEKFNNENLTYLVQNLFGKVTCPHCRKKFVLLKRLLEIEEYDV